MIDLRSDTVSRPTEAMRRAMAEAAVGDDAYGDDPTVNELERETAELLGKEAAVFTPSGTMANQLALRSHTEPGDVVLLDNASHIYLYENGAAFAFSGLIPRFLAHTRGVVASSEIEAAVPPVNPYFPKTLQPPAKLVCLEHTHNVGGGKIWPLDSLQAAASAARGLGLRLHMDGARLWNASAATGIAEKTYAAPFDTIAVCYSKGLGAPVGSALVGSREIIERARRFRSQFGGAMRQAGIIAAGALYGLRNNRARLVDDHANAKRLANGIAEAPGIVLDPATVETNIVRFGLAKDVSYEFAARLLQTGVRAVPSGKSAIRLVTCLNLSDADIDAAVDAVRKTAATF